MSKNDRHLPYAVAYKRVTGRDPHPEGESTVRHLEDIVNDARTHDAFVLEMNRGIGYHYYTGGKFIGHNTDYRDPSYPFYRTVVDAKELVLRSTHRVYPEDLYTKYDGLPGIGEWFFYGSPDTIPEYRKRTDDHIKAIHSLLDPNIGYLEKGSDELLEFMDRLYPHRGYNKKDKEILISDLHSAHLVPVYDDNGTLYFINVQLGLYDDSVRRVYLYSCDPEHLMMDVTRIPRDTEHTTREQDILISSMCEEIRTSNKVMNQQSKNSRRTAERIAITNAVKMVNSGVDPLDIDIDCREENNDWFY